jgi:hypothetical protein
MFIEKASKYKHTKRLIILNILSILSILFAFWMESGDDSGVAGIGWLPLVVPIWIVWAWTLFADIAFAGNWLEQKMRSSKN